MFACFKLKKLILGSVISAITVVITVLLLTIISPIKNDVTNKPVSTALTSTKDGIKVPIIMYHSILKDTSRSGKYVVTPTTLENDLKYLNDKGYVGITVKDLIDYVYDDKPLPEKPVIITFDDGFYNNITYAIPLLEKYNMKAVISIIGEYTDKFSDKPDPNPAYSYMEWEDIKNLNNSGLIEIGNHTYSMHNQSSRMGCMRLPGETVEAYTNILNGDIMKLQNLLSENSEVTPNTFTYPFGFISKESTDILKSMGFKASLTCFEKMNYITKDPNCLFGLDRYNRPSYVSTNEFMKKALSE